MVRAYLACSSLTMVTMAGDLEASHAYLKRSRVARSWGRS